MRREVQSSALSLLVNVVVTLKKTLNKMNESTDRCVIKITMHST